jgi:hypothetical protein
VELTWKWNNLEQSWKVQELGGCKGLEGARAWRVQGLGGCKGLESARAWRVQGLEGALCKVQGLVGCKGLEGARAQRVQGLGEYQGLESAIFILSNHANWNTMLYAQSPAKLHCQQNCTAI